MPSDAKASGRPTHDRFGHRIDEVAFHPAWHALMEIGMAAEVHALPWVSAKTGAHVARAALAFLMNQAESGVCCPLAMSFAGVASLRRQPDLAAEWEPRLTATAYDRRFILAPAGPRARRRRPPWAWR